MNTSTQQPDPLQLAEWIDFWSQPTAKKAASELRRLHAENEQLRADLEAIGAGDIGPLMPPVAERPGVLIPSQSLMDQVIREIARYCNTGEMDDAESLLASLQFSIDPNQQPPTTEQSSVVQSQGEQKPRAWLHIDSLGGEQAFTNEPPPSLKAKCQPLYTHSQNLNCKSNQARLATLWGYVKADQQPKATFDEVWDAIDWGKWLMAPIRELVREIHSKTSPQPPSKPLTPDVSGVDGVNARLHFRRGWKSAERAHGIGGEA